MWSSFFLLLFSGITYRTREEVSDIRSNRDPIDKLKNFMIDQNLATEQEIKEI